MPNIQGLPGTQGQHGCIRAIRRTKSQSREAVRMKAVFITKEMDAVQSA